MKCPVCDKYMKCGTFNTHHLYFPRRKFKGTRRGRMTVNIHVHCHKRFHFKFLHYCLNKKNCGDCEFTRVCVYNEN